MANMNLDKYVREIRRDAKGILADDSASRYDTECLKRLANLGDDPFDLFLLASKLDTSANWHLRIAYAEILDGKTSAVGVKNGLAIRSIAALYLERSLVARSREFQSLKAYREGVRGWSGGGFWELLWCLWCRQALGLDDGWRQLAQVVNVCEIRGDFEVAADDETYRFPFELTRFLALDRVEGADVSRLDAVPQLLGLADAWDDDTAFAALTERWCDWHWRYSERRRADVWNFANQPHDILFPSWVFAIDRRRQDTLGCSALGRHALIDYGRRFISAVHAEAIAPPPVLVAAEKKYAALFGMAPWEMTGCWKEYVARG